MESNNSDINEIVDNSLGSNADSIISLGIGENIPEEQIAPDNLLLVLSGKIRVLKILNTGEEKTIILLNDGDIFDTHVRTLKFIASVETQVCLISRDKAFQDHDLKNRYERITKIFDQADNIVSKPVFDVVGQVETVQSDQNDSAIPFEDFHLSAENCINQVLSYYKQPVPDIHDEIFNVKNIEELKKHLEFIGFKTEKYFLTWAQLLNNRYPLILEDENGIFHWITSRRGNSLIEKIKGEYHRFMPDDKHIENNFSVISLNPVKNKDISQADPFSNAWYFSLFCSNWFLTVQMIFSSIMVQILTLGMPIFYMVIFDRVFGRQNLSALDVIAIGMVGLLVFDLFIKMLRSYILAHFTEIIDKESVEISLHKIFSIPLSMANRDVVRGFMDRFGEIVRTNQVLATTFLISSLDVLFSFIVVVFLFYLHWQMALVSISPLIPAAILIFWTGPRQKCRAIVFSKSQKQSQAKVIEILENNETVRSINATHILLNNLVEKTYESYEKNFKARFDQVSTGTLLGFITSLGSLATLYFGAYEVLEGKMSFGIYLAINMLGRSFVGSIMKLLTSLQQFQEAMNSSSQLKTLFTIEDEKERNNEGIYLSEISGHINFVDVCFRYQPELPVVLNNINFEIRPREKIILTGKSGSGKTTLIRMLQRLYDPISGYIILDGLNIADISLDNLRSSIGVALQKPGIFAGTIRDNITIGNPYASMETILEATSLTQLDQVLLRLPKGLDTQVLSMGANFSGGQIAQIALSRILIINPKILIIDEALSALDLSLQGAIFTKLFEKFRNSTCIFVTDYIPAHQQVDRIVVLQEGQIVEQGKYADLIKSGGYYYHLYANELIFSKVRTS
ncbi:MAG: peptidase domain-containing ABC transporter [Candidatus Gastranaerophilales bacterium]|nr:peptidase domain-containing ABC transporter [Candidatus Gastranaerophilales bacterium]